MARLLPETLPTPSGPLDLVEQGLDLMPIPAAQVVQEAADLRLLAANRAYRLAGLGTIAERSPMLRALGGRIAAFLAGDASRDDFDWDWGEEIDCRHYRVTLARPSAAVFDRCLVSFVDQTSQQRTERSLRREMTTDSLTGLPNRQGFGDLLERATREAVQCAVLVVDLDRFGRFNACLGSLSGDELLLSVARRIKGALRSRDTLARIGGDEFGILMAVDENRAEAHHLASRIERALSSPFRLSDYEIKVECSIGLAFDGDGADGADEVIRQAQFALKRAKASGRTESYQTQAFAIAREQFGLETALRRAIEAEELQLAYQPILDLATDRIVAFEALARWPAQDGGDPIEPSRFIAVAEESGLIVPLGRWALDEATRTLARWDALAGGDCGVQMAVNVSPIQLQRDAVPTVVERALAAAGLAGHRLKLELTESALVGDPERTAMTMHALKELGTTLALDDFGTGYSNLAYLQQLPIDMLKIDHTFVAGMLGDRDKLAIVRAILSLAQALGMRTVAEGIETRELARTLGALGCSLGQGFFYARPLGEDDAWALIAPPASA